MNIKFDFNKDPRLEDYSKMDKRSNEYGRIVLIDKTGSALRKEIKNKIKELVFDEDKRRQFLYDIGTFIK